MAWSIQLHALQEDWAIEYPSTDMTPVGGKDTGENEADFAALHSMVDGRVEGEHCSSLLMLSIRIHLTLPSRRLSMQQWVLRSRHCEVSA